MPSEVIESGKRVRIYRCNNRVKGKVYLNFRVADYTTGKRKLKTFAKFSLAVEYARKILNDQKAPLSGRPRKIVHWQFAETIGTHNANKLSLA